MASHHAGAEDYLHEEGAMASTPSVAGATITPPSTPGGGSTFLDLSGSAYASESVMNSGAQNKVKSQVATRGCPTRLPQATNARNYGCVVEPKAIS